MANCRARRWRTGDNLEARAVSRTCRPHLLQYHRRISRVRQALSRLCHSLVSGLRRVWLHRVHLLHMRQARLVGHQSMRHASRTNRITRRLPLLPHPSCVRRETRMAEISTWTWPPPQTRARLKLCANWTACRVLDYRGYSPRHRRQRPKILCRHQWHRARGRARRVEEPKLGPRVSLHLSEPNQKRDNTYAEGPKVARAASPRRVAIGTVTDVSLKTTRDRRCCRRHPSGRRATVQRLRLQQFSRHLRFHGRLICH